VQIQISIPPLPPWVNPLLNVAIKTATEPTDTRKDQDAPSLNRVNTVKNMPVEQCTSKYGQTLVLLAWIDSHVPVQDFLPLRVFVAWHLIDGLVGVVGYLVPP
jgi:phage terminase large subunit-like protein